MTKKDILSMISKGKPTSSKITKPSVPKSFENLTKSVVDNAIINKFSSRWKITGTHLVSNVASKFTLSSPELKKVKIAAFDLDDTLVKTKSGYKFTRSPSDWQWWHAAEQTKSNVVEKIRQLVADNYTIVIFTNQGAVIAEHTSKSYLNFTNRVNFLVEDLQNLIENIDVFVFASTKRPSSKKKKNKNVVLSTEEQHNLMRKPNIGMWNELINYLQIQGKYIIDMENSFYVGDAAGRPGDFSDSDKKFAENIELKKFIVPEIMFDNKI